MPEARALLQTVAAVALLTLPAVLRAQDADKLDAPSPEQTPPEHTPQRWSLTAGVETTNAYYWRGFRQEDRGLIVQPWATLDVPVYEANAGTLSLVLGTWHSFHDRGTGARTDDDLREKWFEADITAGLNWSAGAWKLGGSYGWYFSPNDAFETNEEIILTAAYDDSEALGAWAMNPSALLGIETGRGLSDGADKGVYLQLGVEPRLALETQRLGELSLTFPCQVGLSLGDYYQDQLGEDDFFGFASLGAKLTLPLPVDGLSFSAGASWLILGETSKAANDGDGSEVVWTLSVGGSW